MVVDGRGNAYIGNLGFQPSGGEFRPGILAVVSADGIARQVADELYFPNRVVVTPDNSILIIAELRASRLTAFDINPDGSLSNRRIWDRLCRAPRGAFSILCQQVHAPPCVDMVSSGFTPSDVGTTDLSMTYRP